MVKLTCLLALLSAAYCGKSQDISINPNITWNGECNLATNPANQQISVVAWMKATSISPKRNQIAVSSSTNGGLTWSAPVYLPHQYTTGTCADPTLCYKSNGDLYLAFIDHNAAVDSAGDYVARSPDNGTSWSAPVKAMDFAASANNPVDRPWLIVDNSTGAHNGRVYVTTRSYSNSIPPFHVWCVYSDNNGLTWSAPHQVDSPITQGPAVRGMGVPAITPDGKLCVAYPSYDTTRSPFVRYMLSTSYNGQTFTNTPITNLPVISAFPASDTLVQKSYNLAANPLDSNNLIFSWVDNRNGDPDIYSVYTVNGGASWSTPFRVNDDAVSNSKYQDMLWANFSPTGNYVAAWRDRRNDNNGQTAKYDIYSAISFNKGVSFAPNIKINDSIGTLYIPVNGNDFLGIAAGDSTINVAWSDKRTGKNLEYFNKYNYSTLLSAAVFKPTLSNKVVIYPNPSNSEVTIKLPTTQNVDVEVYDINGSLMHQYKNQNRLNISTYAAGVYYVKVTFGQNELYQKFIKQ